MVLRTLLDKMIKTKNKFGRKEFYLVLLFLFFFILIFFSFSCSKDKSKYCIPPKAINGMCHSSCDSPPECHYTFPGMRGPGCRVGQVCSDGCGCVWVDKDLDSYPSVRVGSMHYDLDCDDEDPTVFPNASEVCDNKDNDCDGRVDIDEGLVCGKNIYFCKTPGFSNASKSCDAGAWCSSSASRSSASCGYTTNPSDVGVREVYPFVCDDYFNDSDYGCYGFGKGSFSVLLPCDNNNVKDEVEECDGSDVSGLDCEDFGYGGGALGCDSCSYDFNKCAGVVCDNDNLKESGEECDGSDLNDKSCEFFGFAGGNLGCNSACLLDKSDCSDSLCKNGVLDAGEDCDSSLEGKTCEDFGYNGGNLLCGDECSYDFSNCVSVSCDNNNVSDLGESCDGSDLDGRSCLDFGFSGGNLSCSSDCDFNFSGCEGYTCNNDNVAASGEACDGFDLRDKSCVFFDTFDGGLLGCDSSCMFDRSGCSLVCDNDTLKEEGEECDGYDLNGRSCEDFGRFGGNLTCSPSCAFDLSECGPSCVEDWECGPWSSCLSMSGNSTRECIDLNNCGTSFSESLESKPCDPSVCVDNDSDSYCVCVGAGCDCDDSKPSVNPSGLELCDGKDNNCDGVVDVGCPCESNDTRSCGISQGVCREGSQSCVNGYWGICYGSYVGHTPEICGNGLDEDCDGYSDEFCGCEDGSTQECGVNTGVCKKGVEVCFDGNWSVCSGSVDPSSEKCSGGKDEDCDGLVDCNDPSCSLDLSCKGLGSATCFDKVKNQGELGVDCGGPCPSCSASCGFGFVKNSCVCGEVVRYSGYCCDGVYQLESCDEPCLDSDNDGVCDADAAGVESGSTLDSDGDGVPNDEDVLPFCNGDNKCDAFEDSSGCPDDCGKEGGGIGKSKSLWAIIILVILLILALLLYMLFRKGVIKMKGSKAKPSSDVFSAKFKIPPYKSELGSKKRDISNLVAYVKASLNKNEPKSKIANSALAAGWDLDEVDSAFSSVSKKSDDKNKKFFSIFKNRKH